MDKQTTLGFILIMLVLILWMWIQTPPPQPHAPVPDTLRTKEAVKPDTVVKEQHVSQPPSPDSLGKYFSSLASGTEKILLVRTGLYTAEITTRGGLIKKWELNKFLTWDKQPVQLVDYDHGGDLSLLFTSSDGKLVDTRALYFNAPFERWKTVTVGSGESFSVDLVLPISSDKKIIKRFTFTDGKYDIETEIKLINLQDVISNYEYEVTWENGLRYAEHNSVDESGSAMAYAESGGELAEVDATKAGEVVKRDITGSTSWVATRTKYFVLVLIPTQGQSQGAYLEGTHEAMPEGGAKENYSLALKMPFNGGKEETAKLRVYLGPLDYGIIKSYDLGLDQVMSLGAAWIIRPIAEYIMIPLFQFLHIFIPNFGFVIIAFSVIIKLALTPLTRTSMKSMKRMQALQPMMNEIREKYKDDPQKMNQHVMNLYKEYGVNPAAGCLPILLQMPILFALWAVLRSAIELRQADFIWWIHDLSIPDTVMQLPFTIPFFGVTQLSGLALAMGATTFIQQKMSTTDPRQKAMVWIMPIFLTLVFNGLPSGLNLYYFVFNLLSIGQQAWINKRHNEEPLRKVEPKKRSGGIMGKMTKDLPKWSR